MTFRVFFPKWVETTGIIDSSPYINVPTDSVGPIDSEAWNL